jgi:glycosyltransferase involved in cell wall biosynthesis
MARELGFAPFFFFTTNGSMVSIITVSRNARDTIGDCLASVAAQSVRPEHVIVDGMSTDGTLGLLRGWTGHRLEIVSEPDQGIYDAMNKGIARARGDIIGILNADDWYASNRVLEQVRQAMSDPSVDACYGDLVYVQANAGTSACRTTRYWRAGTGTARSFYHGWMPPHPTFFVRRSVYERHGGFRLDLGSAADYEFMLRVMVKHGVKAAYVSSVLVRMRVGGVSNAHVRNRLRANRKDRMAWKVNDLDPHFYTLWLKPLRKVLQWWV